MPARPPRLAVVLAATLVSARPSASRQQGARQQLQASNGTAGASGNSSTACTSDLWCGNGVCWGGHGADVCACNAGWTGTFCTDAIPCPGNVVAPGNIHANVTCNGRGTCEHSAAVGFYCNCTAPWGRRRSGDLRSSRGVALHPQGPARQEEEGGVSGLGPAWALPPRRSHLTPPDPSPSTILCC